MGTLAPAFAMNGPVILGGDDLTDHGNNNGGAGPNQLGWLYIEKAIMNLESAQTRPIGGGFTTDILALGSSASAATGGNAGAAIGSAAGALGLTVTYCDGAAAITTCLNDLQSGAKNYKIIWTAGTGAGNDLVATEGVALTAGAAIMDAFVASGGGLMSHGFGTTAYGWLSTLLPGLIATSGCVSTFATLTAEGIAAFPGLTNTDIRSGPCHNHFTGNFGSLQVLANDSFMFPDGPFRPFILGLQAGTIGGGITGGMVSGVHSSIDTTALLLAGAQSSLLSIVSVLSILGAFGIGAFYYIKRKN